MERLSQEQVNKGLINLQYYKYSKQVLKEMAETVYETALLLRNGDALHLLKKLNELKELKNSAPKQNNTPSQILGELFYEAFKNLQDKRLNTAKLAKQLEIEDVQTATFANRIIEGSSPLQGLKYDYKINSNEQNEIISKLEINESVTNKYGKRLRELNMFNKEVFGKYKDFLKEKNPNYEEKESLIKYEMLTSPFHNDGNYMLGHGKRSLKKYNQDRGKE